MPPGHPKLPPNETPAQRLRRMWMPGPLREGIEEVTALPMAERLSVLEEFISDNLGVDIDWYAKEQTPEAFCSLYLRYRFGTRTPKEAFRKACKVFLRETTDPIDLVVAFIKDGGEYTPDKLSSILNHPASIRDIRLVENFLASVTDTEWQALMNPEPTEKGTEQ